MSAHASRGARVAGASPAARAAPADAGARVLDALRGQPGGPELLALAGPREDVALVGGAVRDLLLDRPPGELDVVVDSGAADLARELAHALAQTARARAGGDAGAGEHAAAGGPTTTVHERFRTAAVAWPGGRVDVAERRAESYPAPGALPQVRPGDAHADLARRDFAVNAIAVPLGGPRRGQALAAEHAFADLRAGLLRVLHERSFLDDPTRLLRLARYSARLGFAVEPRTRELAGGALAAGALASVSGSRIGAELRLALREDDALAALAALDELGVLAAVHPSVRLREQLARRALELLPADGRADLLLMASLLLASCTQPDGERERAPRALLDRLEFPAGERDRVLRSARAAPALAERMALAATPSDLHDALAPHTLEAVALAGAHGGGDDDDDGPAAARATLWLARLRHVRLEIGGEDLIAAGVPAGPQIGRRLSAALARKLDGELAGGREAELAAALEAPA